MPVNKFDPDELSLGHFFEFDYFWASAALAQMGIAPMLGPKRAKWFCVVNQRLARLTAGVHGASLAAQVAKDLFKEYGVRVEPEQDGTPERQDRGDSTVVKCIYCSEVLWVPVGRGTIRVRCPACSRIWNTET